MQAPQLFRKTNRLALLIALVGISLTTSVSAASNTMVKKGKQLYEENCTFCHQKNGGGQVGLAPSVTNKELLSTATDKYLINTIRDGRDGTSMTPFNQLGTKGIQAIVAYLRSFEKLPNRSAEVARQEEAFGDPRLGKQWYEQICSTCHGMAGEGYEGWRIRHSYRQEWFSSCSIRWFYSRDNQGRTLQHAHVWFPGCKWSS